MYLLKKIFKDTFFWLRDLIVRFSQLLYFAGREFLRDQCPTRAAAMTYFTMLSLVPLIILVFAIFKASGGGSLIDEAVKPLLFKILSPGTGEAISGAIDQLLEKSRPGTLGTIGVIFLLITAFSLMDQLEFNLNKIWSVKGKRSFLQRWVFYWAALSIFPLLVGTSVSLSAYLKSMESVLQISDRVIPQGVNFAPFLLQGLAFFLLYMIFPKTKVKFLPAFGGAVIASILWEISKSAYLFYSEHALNYNLVYGSLATLPLFMIWLFLSWMVVLFGAEISYAMQNFDSLREAGKRVEVPFQTYEILGLSLMYEVCSRFIEGAKPLKVEDFIAKHQLPSYLIETAVEQLLDFELLKMTDGELIPARDPENLTVDNVIEAVKVGGAKEINYDDGVLEKRVAEFLSHLEESDHKIKAEWNMKKLVQHWGERR